MAMKITTRIKLFFSKKLRHKLSCVSCQLYCGGSIKIRKDTICNVMISNYENKGKKR